MQRGTSRPGSFSFCISGCQKLLSRDRHGTVRAPCWRGGPCSQQGFPECRRATAWPLAPRVEPCVWPGRSSAPSVPFGAGLPFPAERSESWTGCRESVAWCCPVSSLALGSSRPTWRWWPSRMFCQSGVSPHGLHLPAVEECSALTSGSRYCAVELLRSWGTPGKWGHCGFPEAAVTSPKAAVKKVRLRVLLERDFPVAHLAGVPSLPQRGRSWADSWTALSPLKRSSLLSIFSHFSHQRRDGP